MKPLVKIVPPLRIIGILLLALTGCRKELCYTHDEHSYSVKTHVKADWEQEWERTYYVDWEEVWREEWPREYDEFRPDPGTGIRALVYTDGKMSESNLEQEGGRLYMSEGMQTLLFYNNNTKVSHPQ